MLHKLLPPLAAAGIGAAIPIGIYAYAQLAPRPATITAEPSYIAINEVKAMGILQTASSQTLQQIPLAETFEVFGQRITAAELHYEAVVNATAGLDLSQATLEGDTITLPPVTLQSVSLDVDLSDAIRCNPAWWNSNRQTCADMLQHAQQLAEQKAAAIACESELIPTAQAKAIATVQAIAPTAIIQVTEAECTP